MENKANQSKDFVLSLNSISHADWKIFFYEEFGNLLINQKNSLLSPDVWNELSPYLSGKTKNDFRIQLTIKSVPFLVGFFFQDKEIRFYSPKLSQELFLLQQREILNVDSDAIKKLRSHTEKAVSLDVRRFPSTIEMLISKNSLPDLLNDEKFSAVETKSNQIIKELLFKINQYRPSYFEIVSDYGLGLTAQYALLRIHLLKFLAILPSLDHDQKGTEVKRILLEALVRFLKDNKKANKLKKKGQERSLPASLSLGIKIIYFLALFMPANILAIIVRKSVRLMAKRFIAGETIEKADKSLHSLSTTGRDVTLDQLGELVVSEKEADHYKNEVLKLIKGFSIHVPKGSRNKAGINRAHVSIKVSALCSDFKPHAFDYTYKLVSPRLLEILKAAKEEDVFINIDAEHYHYRDIVFKIYQKVLLENKILHDFQATGIVIQAYLRDGSDHLEEIIQLAKLRGIQMPVRLVKGAYWDAETVEGDAHSFDAPQFLNKEETDIHFRQLIFKIYEAYPHLKLAIASHNFSDHAFAEALKDQLFPNIGEIEHQCLHMTYEALSTALAKMNWATRNYVPVGSLLVGMAYLVRRIMENSSQVGVLTIMRSHKKNHSLISPQHIHVQKIKEGRLIRDPSISKLEDEFFNVSPARLYIDKERSHIEHSLVEFRNSQLSKSYSNNFELNGNEVHVFCSSSPNLLVGKIRFANVADAQRAVETISNAYDQGQWSTTHWSVRSSILIKSASIMLARRAELASLIVYEAGKSISEALADVDEAIDFLNFYSRNEAYLNRNIKSITSRGPTVVISPWNFPLAIPCGMVVSALVAGNSVILKSAEQTPLIAQVLVDLLHEAGVPENALIHLPGEGETVGDFLVRDQRISTIVFTGSKAVGTYISNVARNRIYTNKLTNKKYLVKAITEMGGKNAVIVTQNAELDETVSGILYSAFGHAGQKCSACSRVIVHNSLKQKLIDRLRDACSDLKVGESFVFETTVNPIISKDDQERLVNASKLAKEEAQNFGGSVVVDRSNDSLPGFCVGPVVIELPFSRAFDKDSFAQKELFGPIIHIMGFNELDEAIELYNCTDYALTGGIFSQSQDDIDYLSAKLESGNIYVNRSITGARVAIEPFGGFKLSGTGPKAGGKHYLHALHQISDENGPLENMNGVLSVDEGSEYLFDLLRPSKLSAISRKERIEKFLELLISSFERQFRGIYGQEKEIIRDYKKWISKKYVNFIEKNHKNRTIPGQLSYDSHELTIEHCVLVSVCEIPTIKTFIQFLSCISSGAGVIVLARNHKSFLWWKNILDLLLQAGFSKENIDVFHVNSKDLKRVLNNPKLSMVLFDGDLSSYKTHLSDCFEQNTLELRMKHILTKSDHISSEDFYNQLLQFINVRSFAVNTMRHGAPLDLEF